MSITIMHIFQLLLKVLGFEVLFKRDSVFKDDYNRSYNKNRIVYAREFKYSR